MLENIETRIEREREQRRQVAADRIAQMEREYNEQNSGEVESYNDILNADWQMSHAKKQVRSKKTNGNGSGNQLRNQMMEEVVREEKERLYQEDNSNFYTNSRGLHGGPEGNNHSRRNYEMQENNNDYDYGQEDNGREQGRGYYSGPEEIGESVSMKFAQEFVNRMSGGQGDHYNQIRETQQGANSAKKASGKRQENQKEQLYGSGYKENKKMPRPTTAPMSFSKPNKPSNKIPKAPKEIQPGSTA